MFKNNLLTIRKELNDNTFSRAALLNNFLNKKLDRSLNNYETELKKTVRYLLSRDGEKVLKNIDRLKAKQQHAEEEEEIEEDVQFD